VQEGIVGDDDFAPISASAGAFFRIGHDQAGRAIIDAQFYPVSPNSVNSGTAMARPSSCEHRHVEGA